MNNSEQDSKSGAFSIQDIIRLVQSYIWELIKYAWVIAIFALALGYNMRQSKVKIPVQYVAFLNFSINESSGADQSFMQQILGSGMLGITALDSDLGLGKASGGMPILQELIKTRKTIELVLFQKIILPNESGKTKDDFFINHYLELFGFRDEWRKAKSNLANVYFTHDSIEAFSRDENSLLLMVYGNIIKNNLSDGISKAGILTLRFRSPNEIFSYNFLKVFYDELNTYYTQKSIEKQRRIYEAANIRRDSLEKEMNKAEKGYIGYLNTHNLAAMGQHAEEIEIQYLGRKLSGEMEAYFMAIRNVEASKIALEQQTPLLQSIDKPVYPLGKEVPNVFMAMVMGLAIGAFLGVALIIAQKVVRDFLKANKIKTTQQPKSEPLSEANNKPIVPTP